MALTETEIGLIRQTYGAVQEKVDDASSAFYRNLFSASEEIKGMFRGDMNDQGMRFMTALGTIVHSLDDSAAMDEKIGGLGTGHAALGVRPKHYVTLNEVLITTLAEFAGETWSPEAAVAWQKALDAIAEQMLETVATN